MHVLALRMKIYSIFQTNREYLLEQIQFYVSKTLKYAEINRLDPLN